MVANATLDDDRAPEGAYGQALDLARRIEALLAGSASADAYDVRLAEAMTRSLIDQLLELCRRAAA